MGAPVSFDLNLIISEMPKVLDGLAVTLEVWILGLIGAAILGFFVAIARRVAPRWLDWLLGLYVEIMRCTPLLILLFLLYFGGPYIGLSLDAIPAGLLGLSLYRAAYFSEIFRAGFEAVPRGHVEAAECVGLTYPQIVRRILLPEMTTLVLPPSVNMAIILLKDTAILSIITVHELTFNVSSIGTEFYAFVESLSLLALFYWGMVEICGWAGGVVERRLSRFRFAQS
jgi:polar amino acid transport system permease protein